SQASEAFEISSRRKISFSLYSECATISSRRLTSAWKLRVSAWVSGAVSWVIGRRMRLRGPPRICGPHRAVARSDLGRETAETSARRSALSRSRRVRRGGAHPDTLSLRLGRRAAHAATPALRRTLDLRTLAPLR